MRARVEVTELSPLQFERLVQSLMTSYQFTDGQTRMCVVFMTADGTAECHVEMPVYELAVTLGMLRAYGLAEAALAETSGWPPTFEGAPAEVLGTYDVTTDPDGTQVVGVADTRRARLEAEWERADPEGCAALRRSAAALVQAATAELPRLVRLPSADQVRDLTAAEAAQLAADMNKPGQVDQ